MRRYRWKHHKPLCRANPTNQDGMLLPGSDVEANYVRQGEVFTPTDAELQAFGARIEEIEEDATETKGAKKK